MTPTTLTKLRKPTGIPKWCRIVREPSAPKLDDRPAMRSPRDVVALLAERLEAEEQEVFIVLVLDAQHRVLAMQEVTRGIVNSSLVHPREAFRLAIAYGGSSIIAVHNHPSGDPTPSADDRSVTTQLVTAGRLLDLPLHDHLIIGHGRYTSFAEAGLL